MDSLRGPTDFDPIFSLGRKATSGCATVRALARQGAASSRLGLIVPKPKAKLAVERNAFKRVARESAHAFFKSLPEGMALDIVIQLSTGPGLATLDEFKARTAVDIGNAIAAAYKLALLGPLPEHKISKPRTAKPKR